MLINHSHSLSPPSTPPQQNSALSRSASLHNNRPTTTTTTTTISRSSTLSSSSSSSSSSSASASASASAFPPTPPQSTHNTPLSQRYRSIANLSQSDRPLPSRSGSRNDIFALSLPQPSLPPNQKDTSNNNLQERSNQHSNPSSYHQHDLIRLKTPLPLRINTSPSSILGQGTHATVHLALAQPNQSKPWKLCAAKLSEDLPGSIKESLVLERLRDREPHAPSNGSRFILGWYGLKDHKECEWIRTPEEDAKHQKQSSAQSFLPPIILILEYCAGGDLFKFAQRAANLHHPLQNDHHPSLKLDSRRWLRWSQELAEALVWCKQRNVLIGDLKPQNVLLTSDLRIKLSDFNRSTILSVEQTKDGQGLMDPQGTGTSIYAAPELVQPPPSPCSFPADIFALGVTLHFLLTGREPYRGVQSAVERMLLISRGAFWEHELAIRWQMADDGQAPATRTPPALSRASSTKSVHTPPPPVSLSTIRALYDFSPDPDDAAPPSPVLASDDPPPARDPRSLAGFYTDGSPHLRFLNGPHIVPEHILLLLARMCAPVPAHRPSIEQVLHDLTFSP